MKLVVIGLDGAGFELIDRWIDTGYLPNLAKIKEKGVWADMRSVLPAVTSPNWKCYSTGKNPGKTGSFGWANINWNERRIYFPAKRVTSHREIWDYLSNAGLRVGVAGMPTTFPPKKVNGFLIAGGEAPSKGFTYPSNLEKELRGYGWDRDPQIMPDINRDRAAMEIHNTISRQFTAVLDLAAKYNVDFLNLSIFSINILHHFLWDREETRKGWQIIDQQLGGILNSGFNIFLMSDHGSNKIEQVFNANTWLEKEGYLKSNLGWEGSLVKTGINQEMLVNLATKLRIFGLANKIMPRKLADLIPNASGEFKRGGKASKVNWQKSKALAGTQGTIYINPNVGSHKSALIEEIKAKLENLVDPSTGHKICNRVYTKDEVYWGEYVEEAPDIIIDQAKGVNITEGIGRKEPFEAEQQRWLAENKSTGLFMAYGPDIRNGIKVENVSILDLCPTILHMMDVQIPSDLDGRVLHEIFKDETKYSQSNTTAVPIDTRETIRDKVRSIKHKEVTRVKRRVSKKKIDISIINPEQLNRQEIMDYYGYKGIIGKIKFYLRFVPGRILQTLALIVPHVGLTVLLHRMRGVKIGQHVYIGQNVQIDSLYPRLITIEDYVSIGCGSMIFAHSTPAYSIYIKTNYYPTKVLPTVLKKDAWIAPGVIILGGITIGENAIVGAGSVVTKDVEPFTIVAGSPAKVIGRLEKDKGMEE